MTMIRAITQSVFAIKADNGYNITFNLYLTSLKRRRIQNEENCLVVRLSFVLLSWWELFLFVKFFFGFALLINKQVRSLQGKKTKLDCFSHQFTWLPELILKTDLTVNSKQRHLWKMALITAVSNWQRKYKSLSFSNNFILWN